MVWEVSEGVWKEIVTGGIGQMPSFSKNTKVSRNFQLVDTCPVGGTIKPDVSHKGHVFKGDRKPFRWMLNYYYLVRS